MAALPSATCTAKAEMLQRKIQWDLAQQEHRVQEVLGLVRDIVQQTLPGHLPMAHLGVPTEVFGSRQYGAHLPDSDIDLVTFVADGIPGQLKEDALYAVAERLAEDARRFRSVQVVPCKRTVTFTTFEGFHVDYSLESYLWHRPTHFSQQVAEKLALCQTTRCLARLLVLWAWQNGFGHRSRRKAIKLPKTVHWVLLAWYFSTTQASSSSDIAEAFASLLQQVATFKFEQYVIDVGTDVPALHDRSDSRWHSCNDAFIVLVNSMSETNPWGNMCGRYNCYDAKTHGGLLRLRNSALRDSMRAKDDVRFWGELLWSLPRSPQPAPPAGPPPMQCVTTPATPTSLPQPDTPLPLSRAYHPQRLPPARPVW